MQYRIASNKMWFLIAVMFLALNGAGLLKMISILESRGIGLRIEKFSPEDETAPAASIRILFSENMVDAPSALAATGVDKMFGVPPVEFIPHIPGRFKWLSRRELAFLPSVKLDMCTPYSAMVSRRIRSLAGNPLIGKNTFTFHTPALSLEAVRHIRCSIDRRVTIALEFSDKVSPTRVKEHLTIFDDAGKEVSFWVNGYADNQVIRAETESFDGDTLIAHISAGLQGVSGPLGLGSEVKRTVKLDKGLRVFDVEPYEWEQHTIRAYLSTTVDRKEVKSFINVDPDVKYRIESFYGGLKLVGEFAPGKIYKITFRKGLKGVDAEPLREDDTRTVRLPDLSPSFSFKTEGIYLSRLGNLLVPLETVNVPNIELSVEKIYANNIVHFTKSFSGDDYPPDDLGRTLIRKELVTRGKVNEYRETVLDLRALLGEEAVGALLLTAYNPNELWNHETRLVLVTDLGLTVKMSALESDDPADEFDSDILVAVNRISDASPVSNAVVSLFTRTNQKISEGNTNTEGIIHFKNVGRADNLEGDNEPFIVTASKGNDTSYIRLDLCQLSVADFDIEGRPYLTKGYEAFVFTERGVYRPGETVHLKAVVRGPLGLAGSDESHPPSPPMNFPVEIAIYRSEDNRFRLLKTKLSDFGTCTAEVKIPHYAPTGVYEAYISLPGSDAPLGRTSFRVQEFIPDRMKVEVSADEKDYAAGDEIAFTVKANLFLGRPAVGRTAEGCYQFVPEDFSPPAWGDYKFGDPKKGYGSSFGRIGEKELDENGECTFKKKIDEGKSIPAALRATLSATVKEIGGRGVSASISRIVHPYPFYIGAKHEHNGRVRLNETTRFNCVAVQPDGVLANVPELQAVVYQAIWNSFLKEDDSGRYRYHSEKEEIEIHREDVKLTNGKGDFFYRPTERGSYVIRFLDDKTKASTSLDFYCGGSGNIDWTMEKPERLEIEADKESYRPGEQAKILVKAPFAGRLLLCVERDKILSYQSYDMEDNHAEVPVDILPSYAPNVYCSATLIRGVTPSTRWLPHRAYGVVPIGVDCASRKLHISLDFPKTALPRTKVSVLVDVKDALGAPRPCEITLAAVDEGICNLTDFQTPDPYDFFYGKRRLSSTISDIYSLLMPELPRGKLALNSSPAGGDPGPATRYLNPIISNRVKPVALWVSNVRTDENGKARAELAIPEFTGALRLMAMAVGSKEFGSATAQMVVKRPFSVETSFPRFMGVSDRCIVPITVVNETGADGAAELRFETIGPVRITSDPKVKVQAPKNSERTKFLHVRAMKTTGLASVKITASLGAETFSKKVEFAVRPTAPRQTIYGSGSVEAGQTARFKIPGDWMEGTANCRLVLAPTPNIKFGGALNYLIKYPYGCVEQTSSHCFALLYLTDLLREKKQKDSAAFLGDECGDLGQADAFLEAGMERLWTMQTYNGGLALWPGGAYPYRWGSLYAAHFFAEAKRAGYNVSEDKLLFLLSYVEDILSADEEDEDGFHNKEYWLPLKAYACFVLSIAKEPIPPLAASWMHRLAEERDLLPPYSRFHLAAAMHAAKESEEARKLIAGELPSLDQNSDTAGLLHSGTRESAILLSTFLDVDPGNAAIPTLVKRLEKAVQKNGHWRTTQENAFALMALGKYARRIFQDNDYEASVAIGGEAVKTLPHTKSVRLSGKHIAGKEVEISVKGRGVLYYYWSAEGVPMAGKLPAKDNNLKIRRRFLSRDGRPLRSDKIGQGQVVVVEISLSSDEPVDNVVVCDLLPAGLEIENPAIDTRETMDWTTEGCISPRHVDQRDDRLLLFTDLPGQSSLPVLTLGDEITIALDGHRRAQKRYYRYVARAVTRGTFHLPQISGECMYDPSIVSIHGGGRVRVVE